MTRLESTNKNRGLAAHSVRAAERNAAIKTQLTQKCPLLAFNMNHV